MENLGQPRSQDFQDFQDMEELHEDKILTCGLGPTRTDSVRVWPSPNVKIFPHGNLEIFEILENLDFWTGPGFPKTWSSPEVNISKISEIFMRNKS